MSCSRRFGANLLNIYAKTMEDEFHASEQAERCRRLASQINDHSARDALERLAEEYESGVNQPPGRGDYISSSAN